MPSLKSIQMGDECFTETEELKLIGLKELERVVIGNHSFIKNGYSTKEGMNPNHHFYLKNCKRLKELKIGCYSFRDYSVFVIENMDSLEVIEIGELSITSSNFFYACLELKSECDGMK